MLTLPNIPPPARNPQAQVGKKSKKVKKDQWAKAEEAAPPEEDSKKGKKDKTKHKKVRDVSRLADGGQVGF